MAFIPVRPFFYPEGSLNIEGAEGIQSPSIHVFKHNIPAALSLFFRAGGRMGAFWRLEGRLGAVSSAFGFFR
jgi:hypothetical protein